jgi:chaperonin cofactor prefoldin
MARRKQSGEVNIGSDSFLDVIANIVGILIILIVIAGIRVGRAPVAKKPAHSDKKTAKAKPVETRAETPDVPPLAPPQLIAETPDESKPADPILAAAAPEPEAPEEPHFEEVTEPPQELQQRIQELTADIKKLELNANVNQTALKELEEQQSKGELQFASGRDSLLKEKAKLDSSSKSVEQVLALIESQEASLNLLKSQLEDEKKRGPKVKALKHQVTPLSRSVANEQIHVRISKNRISIVPIHELLESAMRQAKKHIPELATARTKYGMAGPIGGYSLEYKLSAEHATLAEQSRHGPGMMRIALSSFRLEPESELREESIEEALKRGSMFDIAVQTAEPGSTFTLWTYPESFTSYRAIQARLHELGYTVAGRPLPIGIPISGSPDGSASAGQ